jgi:hypothetical protein
MRGGTPHELLASSLRELRGVTEEGTISVPKSQALTRVAQWQMR